jgi:hypothetical protein
MTRRFWIFAGMGLLLRAQDPDFVCPMDREVRAKARVCPRCGMKLVAGTARPVGFRWTFARSRVHPCGRPITLEFRVLDWEGQP